MKSLSTRTFQCGVTIQGLTTLSGTTYLTGITNTSSWDHVIVGTTAQGQIYTRTYAQFMSDVVTGINLSNYVPTSRTITINGVTQDLAADRAWTIASASYTSKLQHTVKAGVAISKGQAVYVTSADGTNMIVGLASNASEATSSKTMGLLDSSVAINGFANVVTEGLLAGLDTSSAGAEGDPVWLGTGGNLIYGLTNKPYAPSHLVFIGIVTRKNISNGEIFVKVQNGFELEELHNVDLKTNVPVNGEILGYNGTLWVNKTIAGWLGYTPANASGTTNYLSKFTGSTTLGDSKIIDNGSTIQFLVNSLNAGSKFYMSPVHADGRINFNAVCGSNDTTLIRAWHDGNKIGFGSGSSAGGGALTTYGDSVLIGTSGSVYFMNGTFGPNNVPYRLGIATNSTNTYFASGVENNLTNIESNSFVFTAKSHTFYTGTTTGNQSNPNQYTPLFLSTAGNVVVGSTTDSGYKFEVKNTSGYSALRISNNNDGSGMRFGISNGANSQFLDLNYWVTLQAFAGYSMNLSVGSAYGVYLDGSNNVGIGTNAPAYKLDVNGNARISNTSNTSLYINETGGNVGDVANLYLLGNNMGWGASLRYNVGAGGANNRLDFYTGSSRRMSIANDTGNILINTTTDSGYKLDISGTVRVQNTLSIYNPSYTNGGSISHSANATLVIAGGPAGENITVGPSNRIFINAQQTRFPSGSVQMASTLTLGSTNATGTNMLLMQGSITAGSALGRGIGMDTTLVAAANNDVLVGLDINPTFTLGSYTGTQRNGVRIQNSRLYITGNYSSLSSEGSNPDSLVQIDSTITGRGGGRAIAVRINPTIDVNSVTNQTFAALEVSPTYQNVGAGSSALAINSTGPNFFGAINTLGWSTTWPSQGGTSTYHIIGAPNGQGFRVQINSNIAGYSYEFDGSGVPTYTLRNNNIDALKVFSTGNVGINTTTDNGYKLDVNGSAIVRGGTLNLVGNYLGITGTCGDVNIFNNCGSAGNVSFSLGGNKFLNIFQVTGTASGYTSGNFNTFTTPITYAWSNGTANSSLFALQPTINNTGTYSGTFRGIYYNPTLTSLTGTTHIAIETTTGDVLFGTVSGKATFGSGIAGTSYIEVKPGSYNGNNRISFNDFDGGTSTRGGFLELGTYGAKLQFGRYNQFGLGCDIYPYTLSAISNANEQSIIISSGSTALTGNGSRLQVYGSTYIKGSGSTSSTIALLIQNSSGTASLSVKDDGTNAIVTSNENPFSVSHTNGSSALSFVLGNGSAISAGQVALRINNSFNALTFDSSRMQVALPMTVGQPTGQFRISGGGGGSDVVNGSIYLTDNTYNAGGYTATSGTQTTVQIGGFGAPVNSVWKPTSGNATYNLLVIPPVLGASGTYSGIIRGIYYNPTVNSSTYGAHRAIETTAGDIIFSGGKVGIGTTSPVYPLDVRSSTQNTTLQILNAGSAGQGNSTASLLFGNADSYTSTFTLSNSGITLSTHGNTSVFSINGSVSATKTVLGTGTDSYTGISATYAGASATLGYGGVGSTGGTTFDIFQNGSAAIAVAQDKNVGIGAGSGNAAYGVARLLVKGSGATSATTSLLVQNSSGTTSMSVTDDGSTFVASSLMKIWASGGVIRFDQQGGAGTPITFWQNTQIYQYVDQASLNIAFRNDYSIVMTTLNSSAINSSAKLQIDSTNRGFLPPRMTNAQAVAISTPATGLQVYDTTNNKNLLYDGTAWRSIATETWVQAQGYLTSVTTPTLDAVTTAGNTTTNSVTVGGLTSTGTIYLPQSTSTYALANVSNTSTGLKFYSGSLMVFMSNGADQFKVGNNYVSTNAPLSFGSQGAAPYIGYNGNHLLINAGSLTTTGYVAIQTGNLLIGTTTDAGYKLDVNGSFRSIGTADKISNFTFYRLNAGNQIDIDTLDSFILSKTDGGYGGGTKPAGSHNGVGIISLQTHLGSYFTQLALDTNQNKLWIRSANSSSTYTAWVKMWNTDDFSSTNVSNWNTAYSWGNHSSAGYATTSYVTTQITNLINGAPAALDTLNELAVALGNDASFATTVTNSLASKVPTSRTITINGVSYDLSANRSWTITSGLQATVDAAKVTTTANIGVTTITSVSATSFDAARFEYTVKKATNLRTGTIMAVWDGTNIQFTETTTNDLGTTTDITFAVTLVAGNAELRATSGAGGWTVKVVPYGI